MPPSSACSPNFDRIARPYRWLEYLTLGHTLEHCRLHYLPSLLKRNTALVLGDGDGRFLAQLLAQNTELHADAVDISPVMLQLLRRNCEAVAPRAVTRLQTHQSSALTFLSVPCGNVTLLRYDLVVTHFFLDCLIQEELEVLVRAVTPHLAPGALWLISDFRIPSGLLRLPARVIVRALYVAFRLLANLRTTRLPDHTTPLEQAGFTRISHHHSRAGILTTELWKFHDSLF